MVELSLSDPEQSLIEAARSGETAAFDRLVGELIEPAFRLAVAMLGNSQEAEDAVQEAAVKAWLRLGQLRPRASLRPWFLAIVANQCRSARRRPWWSVLTVAEPAVYDRGHEDRLLLAHDIDRALSRLSEIDRAILHLRFYQDLPLREIARILGISVSAAKVRLLRASRRLRPELEEEELA